VSSTRLKAFSVDDRRTALVVFLLGNPHLLERGERSQDGASDPDGVLPLGRRDDLDLHGGWRQGGDFLLHAVGDSGVHGRPAGKHRVGVQIFTNVHVTFHDAVVGRLVDAARFHPQEGRLEQRLGASEPLVTDGDDLTIGKFVRLLEGGGGGGGGHFLLKVESDVTKLLLDVADDLTLGGRRERVASLGKDLHEIIGEISSGQIETQDGVR